MQFRFGYQFKGGQMNRRLFVMIAFVITALSFSAVVYAEPLPGTHTVPETTLAVTSAPIAAARENPLETIAGNAAPAIPEPATAILVGITLLGAGTMVRRRRAAA